MAVAIIGMAVLRAHGDATRPMYAMLIGGVINAVLDPLFIFALGLGLDGAALASVIARVVSVGLIIHAIIKHYDGYAAPQFEFFRRHISAVLAIAVPGVLTSVATPVGSAIVTRELAKFGTDAVAGMAVIGRLAPVAFAVVLALSGAIGPIIGQNFGANRMDRVKTAFVSGLQFVAAYVVFCRARL